MLTKKQRWRRVRAIPVLLRSRHDAYTLDNNASSSFRAPAAPTTTTTSASTTEAPTTTTTTTTTTPQLAVSGRAAHPSATAHRASSNERPAARQRQHQHQRELPQPQPRPPSPSPASQPKDAASSESNAGDKLDSSSGSPPAVASPQGCPAGNGWSNHDPPLPLPTSPPASAPTSTPTEVHPLHAWGGSVLNLLRIVSFFIVHGGYGGDNGGGGGGVDCRVSSSGSSCSNSSSGSRRASCSGGGGGDCGRGGWMTGGPGARARAWAVAKSMDGCRASATARPRWFPSGEQIRPSPPTSPLPLPLIPPRPCPRGRVRFHNQIKVVLVASRGEMSSVKADVWWGEKDYHNFRCAYISAARETEANKLEENCRQRMEAELAGQRGGTNLTAGKEDHATTAETLGLTSGSISLLSPSLSTPPPTPPGEGVGSSPGNGGVFSSSSSSSPSSSLSSSPSPPLLLPPRPSREQERRSSLVNRGNGESSSSSSSGIATDDKDDANGSDIAISGSGSSGGFSGNGVILGVAPGPSNAAAAAAESESIEPESLDPGLDQLGAAPRAFSTSASETAVESTTTTTATGVIDCDGNENVSLGEKIPPSGGDLVKAADCASITASAATSTATNAVPATAAAAITATPPPRQGRVQPGWIAGGSSAGDSSRGGGDNDSVSRDDAPDESKSGDRVSYDDPADDTGLALSPADSDGRGSGGRSSAGVVKERAANNRPQEMEGGTIGGCNPAVSTTAAAAAIAAGSVDGAFVARGFRGPVVKGKRTEAAVVAVGLSKSPPYLAGTAAAARVMSVPGAVLVNGDAGKEEGRCWQAGTGSAALKTERSSHNGRGPLPYLGDAPIRRVASF